MPILCAISRYIALLTMVGAAQLCVAHDGGGSYPPNASALQPHIMIGVMDHEPPLNRPMRGIVTDAYTAIGRVPHFLASPPRRSLMLAGTGMLDAELFRVPMVEKEFPDLVRVNVPLFRVKIVAYARTAALPVTSCNDLRDYRVGVVRGIVLMEQCAKSAQNLVQASGAAHLVSLLKRHRVDVVLAEESQGKLQIQPLAGRQIYALETPLQSIPIYHYVHRKQAHLVKPLEQALRKLHSEGDIEFRMAQWRIQAFPASSGHAEPTALLPSADSSAPH